MAKIHYVHEWKFQMKRSATVSIVTMVSFMFQVQGESGRARTAAELLVF